MLAILGPPPARNWVTSVEVSRQLLSDYGIRIHWRTADSLIAHAPHACARRRRNGRWAYSLLAKGEEVIASGGGRLLLVEPENAVQSTRDLHSLLGGLVGVICVCDPYLDDVSVEHLASCPHASELRILTVNLRDSGKLRRLVAAFATEGRTINIRLAPPATLHDRYLIDDHDLLIMGASLNGFGKKQSMIIRGGPDFRTELLAAFERHWIASQPWP